MHITCHRNIGSNIPYFYFGVPMSLLSFKEEKYAARIYEPKMPFDDVKGMQIALEEAKKGMFRSFVKPKYP